MSLDHLPAISAPLLVLPFKDRIKNGFCLIRTDTTPTIEVAIVHNGPDRSVGEAERYAQLLAHSPVMLALLREALAAWSEQFDGPEDEDLSVSGADLVDWFSQWRLRVREQLAEPHPPV